MPTINKVFRENSAVIMRNPSIPVHGFNPCSSFSGIFGKTEKA
jgi:4-hydroxy-L-threonine phosphate dehydrogenase PdxA